MDGSDEEDLVSNDIPRRSVIDGSREISFFFFNAGWKQTKLFGGLFLFFLCIFFFKFLNLCWELLELVLFLSDSCWGRWRFPMGGFGCRVMMGGGTRTRFFELFFFCSLTSLQNWQKRWRRRKENSVFYFLCVWFQSVVLGSVFTSWRRVVSETERPSLRSSGCSAGCCSILTSWLCCFLKTAQKKNKKIISLCFVYSCQHMAPDLKEKFVLSFRRTRGAIKNSFSLHTVTVLWLPLVVCLHIFTFTGLDMRWYDQLH